jgi:zinc protease
LEIEDAMGDLGTSLQSATGREWSAIGFEILKPNLARAMNVLADVIGNPVFPDSEVDLAKKRRLDSLSQEAKDPSGIARRVAPMLAFGPDHPYGTPARGLPGTIEKLTRADMAEFHSKYWRPGSSALIFSGDISVEEAKAVAKDAFGGWSGGARESEPLPGIRPLGTGKLFLIDRQDAPQTMFVQLLPAPPRKSDEYYALTLANAVWGGAATSRLDENLREQKGYSYGIFSFPVLQSAAGAWRAQGTVQADKTKESLVEFVQELAAIGGEKPITEEELANAKANRIRGYAQQFESLYRVVQQVAELWGVELPMTELQHEIAGLDGATLDTVRSVAQKYAAPAQSTLLLVGDLAKIEPGVREVFKGEIVQLDAEGKPLTK